MLILRIVIMAAPFLLQSKIDKLKTKVESLENERDVFKESERLMEEKVCFHTVALWIQGGLSVEALPWVDQHWL